MNKKILVLLLNAALLSVSSLAHAIDHDDSNFKLELDQSIKNVTSKTKSNTLSSRIRHMRIHETRLNGQLELPNSLFLKGHIGYGFIAHRGKQKVTARETGVTVQGPINGNHALDTALKIGRHISCLGNKLTVSPYAGLTYKTLNTRSKAKKIDTMALRNSYFKNEVTNWGPVLGLDATYALNSAWSILAGLETQMLRYKDKVSTKIATFKGKSNFKPKRAFNNTATIGTQYTFDSGVSLLFKYGYEHLATAKRKHTKTKNDSHNYTLGLAKTF